MHFKEFATSLQRRYMHKYEKEKKSTLKQDYKLKDYTKIVL